MAGRTVSIELTDDQAALLDEIAAGEGIAPGRLLLDAIAHGLAMIAAGIDEDELHNATREPPAGDYSEPFPAPPKRRRRKLRIPHQGGH